MTPKQIVKYVSYIIGGITTIYLVGTESIAIGILMSCAGAWFYSERFMR